MEPFTASEENRNSETDLNDGSSVTYRDAVAAQHVHAVSSRYEAVSYEVLENSLSLKELKRQQGQGTLWQKTFNRWLVCFLTGVVTACIGAFINIMVELLVNWKFNSLQSFFQSCRSGNSRCFYIPWLVWIALNCLFTSVAAILVVFVSGPVAGGSGIPQIKCFLNGIKIPGVVTLRTLMSKALGVLFSVAGGLTVGKEGPMIHSGACVAARISQGRTADGRRGIDCKVFEYYRNDPELRDFVAAGAAAGVAAAFGAPIGGVLFSLEEGASFYNQPLTWRMFFTSMVCAFSLNLIMSFYVRDPGDIGFSGLVNFGVFDVESVQFNFGDTCFYMLIGVLGGLLGALFNYINYKLTQFRITYLKKKWQRFGEAILVSAVSGTAAFLTILLTRTCTAFGNSIKSNYTVQVNCPDGEYSNYGELVMDSPEGSVVKLLHSRQVLLWFTLQQYLLTVWTYGVAVPSGLFIPSLMVGAAWGRLIAIGVNQLFPDLATNIGLYALAGAAAQLGGNVRMTISLCVILIEATHVISFGLPLMIVLMLAKWVGDLFNEGLYDIHIEMAEVPILGWEPPHLSSTIKAGRVMATPVETLHRVEKVGKIFDLVRKSAHHGFAVVEDVGVDPGDQSEMFCEDEDGENAMHPMDLNIKDFHDDYPQYDKVLDSLTISPTERDAYIDLRPYMDKAPHTVTLDASLTKIFQLVRGLGLRHILVTNHDHHIVGIITRKDIARFKTEFKKGRIFQRELFISEDPQLNMGS